MAIPELEVGRRKREAIDQLTPGHEIRCRVQTEPWSFEWFIADTITKIHGGGFYGRVIELKRDQDIVIKTAQPDDPMREFWRLVNWGKPFPAQTEEAWANHDYLAALIIHKLLPWVTKNTVCSPKPYGYTFIDRIGYGQVLEKVAGRGPRFDVPSDEVRQIRQAQERLLEIGTDFGLEHIGKIHPDNPFAFANLWIDDRGKTIWLDLHPAIRHTGWVAPFFHFSFHQDIARRLNTDKVTFNQIDVNRFLTALEMPEHNGLIPSSVRQELVRDLQRYEDNLQFCDREVSSDPFVSACVKCHLLTADEAEEISVSRTRYLAFVTSLATEPLVKVVTDLVLERAPVRLLSDGEFRHKVAETIRKLATNKQNLVQMLVGNYLLSGVKTAREQGLISEVELQQVEHDFHNTLVDPKLERRVVTNMNLMIYYFFSGRIFDVIEASSYLSALFVQKPELAAGIGVFVGWVLPSLVRPVGTLVAQQLSGIDLKRAAALSALPKVGSYLATASLDWTIVDGRIWHYNLRNIIAGLSEFMRPWGGWGSQAEAELWRRLSPLLVQTTSDERKKGFSL